MAHPFESKREMHPGRKMAESRYATGGKVEGFARGGHAKGKHHKGTHINIAVVAPHGKGQEDPATSMPPAMPPQAPMAPPPGMAPPGPGGPPGAPPGMPPMKRGGAAYMKGGKVPMTAGAANGVGLKQKMRAYGKNARKQTSEE